MISSDILQRLDALRVPVQKDFRHLVGIYPFVKTKVIEDSTHRWRRLTTFQLEYPRFIHAELLTHCLFARNSSSSRAIPVKKQIQRVYDDPVVPAAFTKACKGMVSNNEIDDTIGMAYLWTKAATKAADYAHDLESGGLHKQNVNRILEPYLTIHTVLTADTEGLVNFFGQRCHFAAQPEMQILAFSMKKDYTASVPQGRRFHLPYVTEQERKNPLQALQLSSVRCARVSYERHDGVETTTEEDLRRFEDLSNASPMHASPLEHPCISPEALLEKGWHDGKGRTPGKFKGWVQFRHCFKNERIRDLE